jgi:alpha-glucosidase
VVTKWWQGAVVYQVYPRSFADTNGDGVGDLAGIRGRLDYLQWLGVDVVWISPCYRSPMLDGGYDVADHCAVDPMFGTMDDFDRLVSDAHARGIRVLMDFVPNHTSDVHPWFVQSRSSRDNPRRDWYIWRDQPNNWRAALNSGSAWTFDERTRQYYLHLFLPAQPDLNWRNPAVVEAMHDVLRFWLDHGVDGFRIDVAHCIGKDPQFADEPRCLAGEPLSDFNDQPYTHELLRGLRSLVDSYPGDPVLVGEVNIRSTATIMEYYGAGDELHLSFNFPPLDAPWDPVVWDSCITEVERHLSAVTAWPTWVLSNHDNARHRTRYGGSLARARAAAILLLTLRGTPFVYQGEELGLEDAVLRPDQRIDPGGRDGSRAPVPWLAGFPHGWVGRPPPLPFPPDAGELAAEVQRADPTSTLALYRDLIAVRHSSAALRWGDYTRLDAPPRVLAYRRTYLSDAINDAAVVIINFADRSLEVPLDGTWRVRLRSDTGRHDDLYDGVVGPDQAVLLGPA